MRKSSFMLAMIFAVLMTMVFPAVAAQLHEPHRGTTVGDFNDGVDCKKGEEVGIWHFVANQTRGADAGTLLVQLKEDPNSDVITNVLVEPNKRNSDGNPVLRNVQHFWVTAPADATVVTAYSLDGSYTLDDGAVVEPLDQMNGRLVISDAFCEEADKKHHDD